MWRVAGSLLEGIVLRDPAVHAVLEHALFFGKVEIHF
jgi:hypothetical protein